MTAAPTPREVVARQLAAYRGWRWDVMPSFGDSFTMGYSHEECRTAADAILAALAAAGYAVVPREPTEAMMETRHDVGIISAKSLADFYRAMIDAAFNTTHPIVEHLEESMPDITIHEQPSALAHFRQSESRWQLLDQRYRLIASIEGDRVFVHNDVPMRHAFHFAAECFRCSRDDQTDEMLVKIMKATRRW
jgi:hypothetical protein